MKLSALIAASALTLSTAALAQQVDPTGANPQTGQAGQDETSDRTPEKATPTPQNQKDTAGGKTSDRSQDKDVKVEHQPGAAGSAGSGSSEGASSGTSGSNSAGSAASPSSPGSNNMPNSKSSNPSGTGTGAQ
jgi:hypothetical protein